AIASKKIHEASIPYLHATLGVHAGTSRWGYFSHEIPPDDRSVAFGTAAHRPEFQVLASAIPSAPFRSAPSGSVVTLTSWIQMSTLIGRILGSVRAAVGRQPGIDGNALVLRAGPGGPASAPRHSGPERTATGGGAGGPSDDGRWSRNLL